MYSQCYGLIFLLHLCVDTTDLNSQKLLPPIGQWILPDTEISSTHRFLTLITLLAKQCQHADYYLVPAQRQSFPVAQK